MSTIDYSVYYGRFHDDSEEHAEAMAQAILVSCGHHFPEDKTTPILDVGCGYGFALRALKSRGYTNLRGVETSPQQAERCRRAGFTVDVVEDTSTWLSRHSNQFGFILLLDVIEHVPVAAQIDFVRALFNGLRKGGGLYLTTPNANAILAARWRYNDYTHHCSFTEHSLHFVLRNGGFEQITLDVNKGIGRMPRRLWSTRSRTAWHKWFVRWCWLQVFKAELPWENLDQISFDLNLQALART